MGMAASQARLLSITSRIADNELRAQLINNSKMRLATESSKVSENYISALNDATMMMTNYDTVGNSQCQALTFNSLTAYSSYNNQYALLNNNGQMFVSEAEDKMFKDAVVKGGNDYESSLNAYLEAHDLKYDTSYFDEDGLLTKSSQTLIGDPEFLVTTGTDNSAGQKVVNFYSSDQYELNDDGTFNKLKTDAVPAATFTLEDLRNRYEGNNNYYSYDTLVNSSAYTTFLELMSAYNSNKKTYATSDLHAESTDTMKEIIRKAAYGNSATTSSQDTANPYKGTAIDLYNNLMSILQDPSTVLSPYNNTTSNQSLIDDIKKELEGLTINKDASGKLTSIQSTETVNAKSEDLGKVVDGILFIGNSGYKLLTSDDSGSVSDMANANASTGVAEIDKYMDGKTASANDKYFYEQTKDDAGNVTGTVLFNVKKNGNNYTVSQYSLSLDDSDNLTATAVSTYEYKPTDNINKYEKVETFTDDTVIKSIFDAYIGTLVSNASSLIDIDTWIGTATGIDTSDYDNYQSSRINLLEFLFGDSVDLTLDISDIFTMYNDTTTYSAEHTDNFEMAYQGLILDTVMNIFGEPTYGWLDTSGAETDDNTDEKVQWYTNQFDKMWQKGYSVLVNGLASSSEWIQFALESGLATMEQVDTNNIWQGILYSNCSEITEVTDQTAVTKAEAEYNRQMNNIEAKDQRFDVELKNIDTEHNALQTEYDSIKNVISKNIERTFKMYS